MTIPEGAATLLDRPSARLSPRLFGRASGGASHPAIERFGRWVAQKGWIHVLLLTGVIGCVYPLVWMFMTSIKTDEELGSAEMVPAIPTFRAQSPYVRDAAPLSKPDDVAPARFAEMLPALREVATNAVRLALPGDGPRAIDVQAWVGSAASLLLNRAVAQLP